VFSHWLPALGLLAILQIDMNPSFNKPGKSSLKIISISPKLSSEKKILDRTAKGIQFLK